MTPETALWLILGITLLSTAAIAPLTFEVRLELARAKKNLANYGAVAISTALLGFVALGLWWYYALETDQPLLGVIPTVSMVWGWIVKVIVKASRTEVTR